MINPFTEVDWKPHLKARRKFAVSLMIGFPSIALLLAVGSRLAGGSWSTPFFAALGGSGLLLGAVLWLFPRIARPFYLAWFFVACCIGILMGNFVLIAIYILIVTPIGLFVRLLGRSAIRKKPDREIATYWKEPERVVDPNHYYRQF